MKLFYNIVALLLADAVLKDVLTGYPFNSSLKVRYFDDLLLIFLYVLTIAIIAKRKRIPREVRLFVGMVLSVVVYCFIQSLFGSSLVYNNAFWTLRDNYYHAIIPVYFLLVIQGRGNTEYYLLKTQHFIFRCVKYFVILEIFFVGFQEVYHLGTTGSILLEDDVTGSLGFGMSHALSCSIIMCLPVLVYLKQWKWFVLALAIPFLASARGAIVVSLASCGLIYVLVYFRQNSISYQMRRRLAILGVLIAVLTPSMFTYYNAFSSQHGGAAIDLPVLIDQHTRPLKKKAYTTTKISFLIYNYHLVQSKGKVWIGTGPGSYASRTAKVLNAPLYRSVVNRIIDGGRLFVGGSSLNVWLVEYGLIGTILFFLIPWTYIIKYMYSSGLHCFFIGFTFFFCCLLNKLTEHYSTGLLFWVLFTWSVVLTLRKRMV
ncbi:hypothetical protein [Desulfogranum japonicum]|uniref:hypothetical protein n=1 Tax=Desulfogranum japonicum TaxID=231447 RepID=UPI00040F1008|nr:hypothetical protein [Desulfogranum japonicum]